MRRVKRFDTYHTLETKDRAALTDSLCDYCGNQECSIRLIMRRIKINRFNAKTAVTRCESYMAIIEFRDPAGLELEFNTFRLGAAWAKRVAPGDVVALKQTGGEIFGTAEVIVTHVGHFPEMNHKHGVDNHLAIAAEVEGKPFDLAKVLTESYGGHRFNIDSTVSVIELRRNDAVGEEGQANIRRLP